MTRSQSAKVERPTLQHVLKVVISRRVAGSPTLTTADAVEPRQRRAGPAATGPSLGAAFPADRGVRGDFHTQATTLRVRQRRT